MEININMGVCKHCKLEKTKKYSYLAKSGNKIYVDEQGRLWKGPVCPDCQAVIRRDKYAKAAQDRDKLK